MKADILDSGGVVDLGWVEEDLVLLRREPMLACVEGCVYICGVSGCWQDDAIE